MVVSVAAYPWEKWFWIYDSANDKYEQKNCNITVREWEMEKVDDYFENIFKAIKKPVDEFYLIIYWDYYNEIRKKFVELSKKHGIKIFRIMNEYELHATVALKYVKMDSDSLWIFRYFFHVISCEIWEKNNNQQFTISELLFQRRTNCEPNFVETDLQNLRTKIRSTSTSPTIVVFQTIPKYIFERVFNIHSRINFFGHVSSLYILLQIVQKQKTNKVIYKIQPMFGRIIDIKIDGIFIESFLQNCIVLLQTRYKINVKDKKLSLKIYENGALTQTINICEKGTTIMNIKIDKNGIFSIILKRKGINFRFFTFSKSIKKNRTIYKIPPKLVYYNKNLNAVGIDLGTSECYASIIRRNGPEGIVLDSKTCNRNLPSYVAIDELNEPCGQYVINRMERKPEFLAFDGKRLIGKEFDEIVIDPLWSFKVINYCEQIYLLFYDKENVPAIRSSTYILSCLLKQIKQKTEEFQGTNIRDAIITIPSSFTEKQKDATKDAANIAGWETLHFLPEPIAALIACSYETDIPNNSVALLFDFGGGTTDICISKIFNGKIEILIESGDAFLGGKDFDRLLINHFNSALKHKYGLNVFETSKKYRLMVKCREIKHTLSVQMDDNLFVDDFKYEEDDVIPITRKEFEDMAVDLILRGKNLIADTLKKAKLNRDEINIVFRVGGGCRIPVIKQMLKEMFPKSKHQCSIHPEELVAKGAALYAYELKNEKNVKDNKSMFF